MKRARISAATLALVAALLFPACSDIPPGQTGPFTDGAAVGGQFARAATVTSAESFATGSTTGTVAAAAVEILAKHKASERQRQVAIARGKAAVAKMRAQQERAERPAPTKKATAKQAPAKKKLPRYIAVDTVKDERTVPAAAKSVVIFDTETKEIVGNEVYDVRSTPQVGGTAKFETFTAEYVGAGL